MNDSMETRSEVVDDGVAAGLKYATLATWLIPEIATTVFSFLPGDDVVALRAVCRLFKQLSTSNVIWRALLATAYLPCRTTQVPCEARELMNAGHYADAFRAMSHDDKRPFLTEARLCEIEWFLRFKRRAGAQWLRHDPYHTGNALPLLRFVGDPHYVVVRVDSTAWDSISLQWRFVEREGYPSGSWIRVRNYPCMRVSRHNDGGYVLQSMWLMYASFPFPPPGVDSAMDDEAEVDDIQRMEIALHKASIPIPDSLVELREMFRRLPPEAQNLTEEEMELD